MQYEEIVHRCFRCGYCKLTADFARVNCPPYRKYRFESYAPGGRMWLLKAWMDGEIPTSDHLSEILYACTSCGSCVEHCVMRFRDELVNIFTAARGELVADGRLPPTVRDYFKSLHTHGNPYREDGSTRGAWAEGLGVPEYDGQEWLLYVGCVGSFDERGRQSARSLARVLSQLGVSFGILGARELCDGNEARVMGEEGLFQLLAEKNTELFRERGVRKIVTLSPHGYHAFRNDYPAAGTEFTAVHATQLLAAVLKGRDSAAGAFPARVTYHDPCYLARHNRVHREPRKVLKAVPGLELVEMARNRKQALCCGGGGGNFFTDILGGGRDNPSRLRLREAVETGAEVLAVACPSCAKMFEDARKAEGVEDTIRVMDVAEILLEASSHSG